MAILSSCVFDPFVSIWRNQSLPLEHRYILIAWCVCTWYHVTGRVSCRTHILSLVYKVYWYYSCGTKFSTTTAAIPGAKSEHAAAGDLVRKSNSHAGKIEQRNFCSRSAGAHNTVVPVPDRNLNLVRMRPGAG